MLLAGLLCVPVSAASMDEVFDAPLYPTATLTGQWNSNLVSGPNDLPPNTVYPGLTQGINPLPVRNPYAAESATPRYYWGSSVSVPRQGTFKAEMFNSGSGSIVVDYDFGISGPVDYIQWTSVLRVALGMSAVDIPNAVSLDSNRTLTIPFTSCSIVVNTGDIGILTFNVPTRVQKATTACLFTQVGDNGRLSIVSKSVKSVKLHCVLAGDTTYTLDNSTLVGPLVLQSFAMVQPTISYTCKYTRYYTDAEANESLLRDILTGVTNIYGGLFPSIPDKLDAIKTAIDNLGSATAVSPSDQQIAADMRDKMDELSGQVADAMTKIEQSSNRPPASDIVTDVPSDFIAPTDAVAVSGMEVVGDILAVPIVLQILLTVFGLALCSYVLFGKR